MPIVLCTAVHIAGTSRSLAYLNWHFYTAAVLTGEPYSPGHSLLNPLLKDFCPRYLSLCLGLGAVYVGCSVVAYYGCEL